MSRAYAVKKIRPAYAGKTSRAPQPKPQPKCKLGKKAHIRERALFPYRIEFLKLAVENFMPYAQKWQEKISKMKVEKIPRYDEIYNERSPQSVWLHTHIALKSIVQILIVYINREFELPDNLVKEAEKLKIKQDNKLAWFLKTQKPTKDIVPLMSRAILSGFKFRTKSLPLCDCYSRGYDHFPYYRFKEIILDALKECIDFE